MSDDDSRMYRRARAADIFDGIAKRFAGDLRMYKTYHQQQEQARLLLQMRYKQGGKWKRKRKTRKKRKEVSLDKSVYIAE